MIFSGGKSKIIFFFFNAEINIRSANIYNRVAIVYTVRVVTAKCFNDFVLIILRVAIVHDVISWNFLLNHRSKCQKYYNHAIPRSRNILNKLLNIVRVRFHHVKYVRTSKIVSYRLKYTYRQGIHKWWWGSVNTIRVPSK